MVTHNWSNLFRDLVASIISDAVGQHTFELVAEMLSDSSGAKVLEEMLMEHGCLGKTYWICAFAVNQHIGICGSNPRGDMDPATMIPHPICSCAAPKIFNETPPLNFLGESINCEMNKFDDMSDGKQVCEGCKSYSYCEACRKKIDGKETRSEGWKSNRQIRFQDCPYFCDSCATLERAEAERAAAQAAEEDAAAAPVCAMCGKPCGKAGQLGDLHHRILQESCFKCSQCGACPISADSNGTLQLPLLRSKVDALLRGEYLCASCAPPAPESGISGYKTEAAAADSNRCYFLGMVGASGLPG
eukprot:Skav202474  [mRNA]  locus=scaffold149:634840:652977:+ [translate_table: standard]